MCTKCGQEFVSGVTRDTFTSVKTHRRAYLYIKLLKAALDLDAVNMFHVKKELRKDNFRHLTPEGT